ncbi:unnamed protein product [Calypogeia fissa]
MRNSNGHLATLTLLVFQLVFATSVLPTALAQPNNATSKRVVYYYQTQFSSGDNGNFVSLLPLIGKENLDENGKPFTTDVLVGAFHLGPEADRTEMHLNDFPPNSSRFDTLWNQTAIIQEHGINVNLFLGGYGDQSFVNLAANFSFYYPILTKTITTYKFNGIDLDVEDSAETTEQMEKLINRLRSDFGKQFIITLAPVASDLMPAALGLSLINYTQLFEDERRNISWFNAIVNNSFPADVIVGGMLVNPSDGGGFVDIGTVNITVQSLVKQFPNFGGVAAFEYFNALPGGTPRPAEWGTYFGKVMGGN